MIYLKDLGEKWGLIPDQYALVFTGAVNPVDGCSEFMDCFV